MKNPSAVGSPGTSAGGPAETSTKIDSPVKPWVLEDEGFLEEAFRPLLRKDPAAWGIASTLPDHWRRGSQPLYCRF